ncbi:MAG: SBBP repeat-containing protein [Bacteroidia bacterium]|nr:SBBP repeat-containing protein [Bacteroidia bacterium]
MSRSLLGSTRLTDRSLFYLAPFFISLFLIVSTPKSHAQAFQWARSIHSEGFDQAYDIVSDPQGYVYVAGQIEFVANFGNGVLIESEGVHDIFIAKYTPSGALVWAKNAGGRGGDKAHSIALDGLGNLFIGGEFEDTAYFDGTVVMTRIHEVNNMFVAKYDTSGIFQWVRHIDIDGPLQTRGYAVSCDAQGNVYTCGGTKGDTYYENNFLFTSVGDYDATIIKFTGQGDFVWAKKIGGAESDKAYGILNDNNGSIYVTGYFVGSTNFGPGVTLVGRGGTDIFLAKYDTAGSLQWAVQAGDTGFDRGWDITLNTNGQIVITGEFQAHAVFGSNTAHGRGNHDMFVAGYDSNGNNLWVSSGGGPEDDIGRGVTHDNSGNIFVMGDYGGSATFPPNSISGNGFSEAFVVSYDASGSNLRWIRSIGGYENDRGRGVAADASGNVYVCGEYVDSAHFDNTKLTGDLLLDMFVAKIVSGNYCSTQLSVSGNITCAGSCDGTAIASANGVAPYTYSWSTNPVQIGEVLNGLCAGTYNVTSTDAGGCTSTASITLTDPAATQILTLHSDASCYAACDGIASVSANGQGPFTYSWSTVPVQTTNVVTGLCAGSYTITTTDAAGCDASETVIVLEPSQMQVSSGGIDPSCFSLCDGEATVSATGQGPFTYSWSTNPVQTGSTASAICAGVYTVTVTDDVNCTSTSSVTISDPPELQVSSLGTDVSCFGSCDGSALVNANGNGPFTYSWSTNPPQTNATVTGLCAGTYSVISSDVNSCSLSSSVTILEPFALQISSSIIDASCIACQDGSIDVQLSGGTGTLQYAWSNGSTTEDLMNISAGIYSVCATDANGCMLCDTFEVLAPTTAVSSIEIFEGVSVFPNPSIDVTTISIPEANVGGTLLELYNSIGEQVYKTVFFSREMKLYSEGLASGVYFLHITGADLKRKKTIPLLLNK